MVLKTAKKHFLNPSLRILLLTNSLIMLAGAMLGPIYALYVEEVGGDLLDASYAGATFAFAAGLVTLLSGKFGDSVKNNKFIMLLGYLIMGIGFLLYDFVQSIWALLLIQVLIGLGEAIYAPIFDALYSKHLDKNAFAEEWSVYEFLFYLTQGIGALVGGFLVVNFGFSVLFYFMGSLCFLSAGYIYFLPKGKI